MNNFTTLLAAGALAATAGAVHAADVSYDASSYNAGGHSLYVFGSIGGLSRDYHFNPVGVFDTNMTDWGALFGRVENETDASNGFDIYFEYDDDFTDSNGDPFSPQFKQEGGGGTPDYYLNLARGWMVGYGDILGGLEFTVSKRPEDGPYATQVGTGSNAKEANDFGMANWFFMDCSVCVNTAQTVFAADRYAGDINIDLDLTDREIGEVPLPAAGWMLLAGIGGLAAARRRRKV